MTISSRTREEVQENFSVGREEPIESLEEFQDGAILTALMEAITKKKAPYDVQKGNNKHTKIGNLQHMLKFVASEGVRVTCSPNDLYDLKASMLMGLLWVLILKYQVQEKDSILKWTSLMTEPGLIDLSHALVSDFDKSWQDGVAFAVLVETIDSGLIQVTQPETEDADGDVDMPSVEDGMEETEEEGEAGTSAGESDGEGATRKGDRAVSVRGSPAVRPREDLLEDVFAVSEKYLGVPRLLDTDGSKLDERGILTYLSYFYNKYGHLRPKPKVDPRLALLEEQVRLLKGQLTDTKAVLAETEENSQLLIVRTGKELRELGDQQKAMEKELAESQETNAAMNKKIKELVLKLPFYSGGGGSSAAPTGEVTIVFTDVQGSTQQWENRPDAMSVALGKHNCLMRELIGEYRGYEVKTEGDSFMRQLLSLDWPEELYEGAASRVEEVDGVEIYRGLRVRMGVHTGKPTASEDPVHGRMDYFGPMVNRAARISGVATGGQVLVSGDTQQAIAAAIEEDRLGDVTITDLGEHRLKDLQTDTQLLQILPAVLSARQFEQLLTPEEQQKADIQEQFAALQVTNSELKARFSQLEEDALEAADKARELTKWLEEMAKKFPKNLAAEMAKMAGNLEYLMASHKSLLKELCTALARCEETDGKIQVLETQLSESITMQSGLQDEIVLHKKATKDIELQLSESQETCNSLTADLGNLKTEAAALTEERNARMKAIEDIDVLLHAKPKGILGRLNALEKKMANVQNRVDEELEGRDAAANPTSQKRSWLKKRSSVLGINRLGRSKNVSKDIAFEAEGDVMMSDGMQDAATPLQAAVRIAE